MAMSKVYKCQLPSECYAHAETVLGETKTVREESITSICNWLDENPHIKAHRDLKIVLRFLRATKFRLDRTKCKIKKFYLMRSVRIEWFENRDPFAPEVLELLDIGIFLPLKTKDSLNRQVFVIRTAAHDPKKHTQNNVFKVGKMLLDLAMHMDETISIYGLIAIFDMKGVTLGHALQLPPSLIRKSVECWECYPCLIKKLEFVNAPSYVNAFLNTFRFFMSTKMKSRIFITKGTSTVDITLPKDLGGTGESYKELALYWKNLAHRNASWYQDDEKYKSIL